MLQGNGTTYAEIKLDASSGILDIAEKQAAGNITFSTGTTPTERARVDSSGRLLVGTSTAFGSASNDSNYAFIQIKGNTSGAGSEGRITLGSSTASASIVAGNDLGSIWFADGSGGDYARILAEADGTGGSSDYPGRLVFSTTADGAASPTERMRLNSSGNLMLNTTSTIISTNRILQVYGSGTAAVFKTDTAATESVNIWNSATSGDNVFLEFDTESSVTNRGRITYNRGAGLIAYNVTSDYRAKTILGTIENPGQTIDALKVYRGIMNGATIERPMFVAHEVQEVAPYCVTGEKDAVDEEGNPSYQQMDHQVLVPLLVAEIQQLRARVAALEPQ